MLNNPHGQSYLIVSMTTSYGDTANATQQNQPSAKTQTDQLMIQPIQQGLSNQPTNRPDQPTIGIHRKTSQYVR